MDSQVAIIRGRPERRQYAKATQTGSDEREEVNLDDGDKEPWIIFTMCEDKRYISGATVQRIRSA